MRSPLNGALCDTSHPFPAPAHPDDWIDSMEYGAVERRPDSKYMQDVDPSPTWRMVAASIWGADCLRDHVNEVASDPYLTTHLLAAVLLVGPPRRDVLSAIALQHVGAGDLLNAMRDGGLKAAQRSVEAIPTEARQAIVMECNAVVLNGWTKLQADIHDGVVRGVPVDRQ